MMDWRIDYLGIFVYCDLWAVSWLTKRGMLCGGLFLAFHIFACLSNAFKSL